MKRLLLLVPALALLARSQVPAIRRDLAALRLDRFDAELVRWYIHDGQLSTDPLDGPLSAHGRQLRDRRLGLVSALERAGGRDPHPCVLRKPTEAQRAARLV